MTSFLPSNFEPLPRRALFLSAHKAAVYHYRKGDLATSFLFDTNDEGREYFARYLRESPNVPMYILVDVFEEEFRRDTIPHVFGGDREALIGRKKERLFRDTPYFYYKIYGRETEGRRDDRVLLSAVTNPKLLQPWLELLDAHKVPMAGIASVPLLTSSIVELLPEKSKSTLVVSLQSISGLRQTFLYDGEFRVSRLVQLPRYGTEPYGPLIREEIEKIRRYLTSMRLSSTDEVVDIYFLVTGELFEELQQHYKDGGLNRYHVLDINDLLAAAKSRKRMSTPFSDQLFVHQLLKQRPENCYASPSDRRYFTMRRLRHGMIAASALLLLGAATWGGFGLINGLNYKQRSLSAQLKTEFYDARYQMARERLPHTPVEPVDLQVAVELAGTLDQYRTTPLEMMRLISSGLQDLPAVRIDNLTWGASTDPDADVGRRDGPGRGSSSQAAPSRAPVPVDAGPQYRYYQIATLTGHLAPFDGDFRGAIATINRFAETLRERPAVHDVRITSMPLDVSSEANLRGSAQARQTEAVFSMKLVLGIDSEA